MRFGNSVRSFQDSLSSGYRPKPRNGQTTCRPLFVLCGSLCTFGLVAVFAVLIVGHGIAKIVIGALYLRACPVQPLLPVYLVVGAIFPTGFYIACRLKKQENGGCNFTCENLGFALGVVLSLFLFAWLTTGTVLYENAKDKLATASDCYLDANVLDTSTTSWITVTYEVTGSQDPVNVTTLAPQPGPYHDETKETSGLPPKATTETQRTSAAGTKTNLTTLRDPDMTSLPGIARQDVTSFANPGNDFLSVSMNTTDKVTSATSEGRSRDDDAASGGDAGVACQSCDKTLMRFTFATLVTEWVCAGLFLFSITCTFSAAKCCV